MNVDIRITIDVTQGGIDLFLSPRDDSFVVSLNASTGYQEVKTYNFTIHLAIQTHSSLTRVLGASFIEVYNFYLS